MAKLPHYALNYDALEATIEEFFHDKDYEWELEKESAVVHNILIVNKEKSKKPDIVKIYNRQGQYCKLHGVRPSVRNKRGGTFYATL